MPSSFIILRVPQRDGSVMYELYEERYRRPYGERCVVYVESSPDIEWAKTKIKELKIGFMDARIYPRSWYPGERPQHLRVVKDD